MSRREIQNILNRNARTLGAAPAAPAATAASLAAPSMQDAPIASSRTYESKTDLAAAVMKGEADSDVVRQWNKDNGR